MAGKAVLTPDAAWAIILEHVRPLEPVAVSLEAATGYCLAGDVRADRDLPPADRSARDGYAVRHDDLARIPCLLRVSGEVAAGSPSRPRVKPGGCVRIFTGANIPPGADTVIMVEQTEERDGMVTIRSSEKRGAYILRRGEDAARNAVLLRAGTKLDSAQVGVCAAVGKALVKVHRRPRVAILCTGSELRSVKDRVRPHEVRDSNGPALRVALAQWGFPGARFSQVADRPAPLLAALRRAMQRHDVVLFTGGVSAGKYDLVPDAVAAAGAVIRFHKLAMRPGKPTLYATLPANRHIFGLPGNPLSVLTAFHEFALPALLRMAGRPAADCRAGWWLPLAETVESNIGMLRYMPARLVNSQSGVNAVPVPSVSSADTPSAGRADGVVALTPERTRFAEGERVLFRPWRPLP